jgi:hypothetical protein
VDAVSNIAIFDLKNDDSGGENSYLLIDSSYIAEC